jgi:hypothetical protein
MADTKKDTTAPQAGAEITQTADESPGGVNTQQVKPAEDMSKAELKEVLVAKGDEKLGVLTAPTHDADKTPYPVGEQPPIERPPYSTGRPDVPIVQSAVLGAGAHTPPDPAEFKPDGRPRLDGE